MSTINAQIPQSIGTRDWLKVYEEGTFDKPQTDQASRIQGVFFSQINDQLECFVRCQKDYYAVDLARVQIDGMTESIEDF